MVPNADNVAENSDTYVTLLFPEIEKWDFGLENIKLLYPISYTWSSSKVSEAINLADSAVGSLVFIFVLLTLTLTDFPTLT